MNKSNVDLLIMIKGEKPAFEYQSPLDFKTYIEGRDGSEFEIEVRNNNNFRIEAVISVDGLSVLDGQPAGDDDETQGYLVGANSKIRIPGWKLNGTKAAAFVFSGRKGGSYVEQSTGQATNKGVIGMMVFQEKVKSYYHAPNAVAFRSTVLGNPNARYYGGTVLDGDQITSTSINAAQLNVGSMSAMNASIGTLSTTEGAWTGVQGSGHPADATTSATAARSSLTEARTNVGSAHTMASQAATSSVNASASAKSASSNAAASADAAISGHGIAPGSIKANRLEVEQTLGTGFGAETEHKTHNVAFDRGEMITLVALFYDDKRGLQKRGIEMVRPSQTRYATSPNPFPNRKDQGCVPPEGWTGK
jgi:hypothetical protein